jgi:hypothetical protein
LRGRFSLNKTRVKLLFIRVVLNRYSMRGAMFSLYGS